MNTWQHISTHLGRFCSVLLPGGYWQLGRLFVERCQAEPVALRATKHQAMPCRVFTRRIRKA